MVEVQHRSFLLEVSAESLRPAGPLSLDLERATPDVWERARSLWQGVGQGYWTARMRWSERRWRLHLSDLSVLFFLALERDRDVGFFELIVQRRGIKVEGFGLLPAQRSRGLGGPLLTAAAQEAFHLGASRVWLHTATDDHPHALPNYLARGFRVYREQALKHPMPSNGARCLPPRAGSLEH